MELMGTMLATPSLEAPPGDCPVPIHCDAWITLLNISCCILLYSLYTTLRTLVESGLKMELLIRKQSYKKTKRAEKPSQRSKT